MPRTYLGGHTSFRPGQLHQLEAGALVLRAGRAAGLLVRTEHPVPAPTPGGRRARGEVDVCWFCPRSGRVLIAWEVDGHDAGEAHFLGSAVKDTAGNRSKLTACAAPISVQLLYSVKNDLSPKPASKRVEISKWMTGVAEVTTDEELMAPGGIEMWMKRAVDLSRR